MCVNDPLSRPWHTLIWIHKGLIASPDLAVPDWHVFEPGAQ